MPETLKQLKEVIGAKALRLLRSGKGIQNIWRNSTPHNWWVSKTKDDYIYYWHSAEREPRPSLSLFTLINNSGGTVTYGPYAGFFRGSDEGMPRHSKFRLRKVFCK